MNLTYKIVDSIPRLISSLYVSIVLSKFNQMEKHTDDYNL